MSKEQFLIFLSMWYRNFWFCLFQELVVQWLHLSDIYFVGHWFEYIHLVQSWYNKKLCHTMSNIILIRKISNHGRVFVNIFCMKNVIHLYWVLIPAKGFPHCIDISGFHEYSSTIHTVNNVCSFFQIFCFIFFNFRYGNDFFFLEICFLILRTLALYLNFSIFL